MCLACAKKYAISFFFNNQFSHYLCKYANLCITTSIDLNEESNPISIIHVYIFCIASFYILILTKGYIYILFMWYIYIYNFINVFYGASLDVLLFKNATGQVSEKNYHDIDRAKRMKFFSINKFSITVIKKFKNIIGFRI